MVCKPTPWSINHVRVSHPVKSTTRSHLDAASVSSSTHRHMWRDRRSLGRSGLVHAKLTFTNLKLAPGCPVSGSNNDLWMENISASHYDRWEQGGNLSGYTCWQTQPGYPNWGISWLILAWIVHTIRFLWVPLCNWRLTIAESIMH